MAELPPGPRGKHGPEVIPEKHRRQHRSAGLETVQPRGLWPCSATYRYNLEPIWWCSWKVLPCALSALVEELQLWIKESSV